MRPDLLDSAPLVAEDARHLATLPRTRAGRNLSFCLVHYPVLLGRKNSGVSSLTNLDIHDIARISRSYAMGPFYAVTPLEDQQRLLQAIVRHWTQGAGSRGNPDRAQALATVCPAESVDAAVEHLTERTGHAAQSGGKFRLLARSQARAPAALSGGCVPHVRRRSCAAVAGYGPGAGP